LDKLRKRATTPWEFYCFPQFVFRTDRYCIIMCVYVCVLCANINCAILSTHIIIKEQ
jgi:hypothetical protein